MDEAFLWLIGFLFLFFKDSLGISWVKKSTQMVSVKTRACLPLTSPGSQEVERVTKKKNEKLLPFPDLRLTVARGRRLEV